MKSWNSSLIIYATIPLFIVYFYLFQRTLRLVDESERKRLITEAKQPRWHIVLMCACAFLLFLLPNALWRAFVGLIWFTGTAWATVRHHRQLRSLGFDPIFTRTMARISYLAGVAVLVFITGMVLQVSPH